MSNRIGSSSAPLTSYPVGGNASVLETPENATVSPSSGVEGAESPPETPAETSSDPTDAVVVNTPEPETTETPSAALSTADQVSSYFADGLDAEETTALLQLIETGEIDMADLTREQRTQIPLSATERQDLSTRLASNPERLSEMATQTYDLVSDRTHADARGRHNPRSAQVDASAQRQSMLANLDTEYTSLESLQARLDPVADAAQIAEIDGQLDQMESMETLLEGAESLDNARRGLLDTDYNFSEVPARQEALNTEIESFNRLLAAEEGNLPESVVTAFRETSASASRDARQFQTFVFEPESSTQALMSELGRGGTTPSGRFGNYSRFMDVRTEGRRSGRGETQFEGFNVSGYNQSLRNDVQDATLRLAQYENLLTRIRGGREDVDVDAEVNRIFEDTHGRLLVKPEVRDGVLNLMQAEELAVQARQRIDRAEGLLDQSESSLGQGIQDSDREDFNAARSQFSQSAVLEQQARGELAVAQGENNTADALNDTEVSPLFSGSEGSMLNGLRSGNQNQVDGNNTAIEAGITRADDIGERREIAEADAEALEIRVLEAKERQFETVQMDENLRNFTDFINPLDSEGDNIRLQLEVDAGVGIGWFGVRAGGNVNIDIARTDMGELAVRFGAEGQVGVEANLGPAASVGAAVGLQMGVTYIFSDAEDLNQFLIQKMRDNIPERGLEMAFPNLDEVTRPPTTAPTTRVGAFLELSFNANFLGAELNLTGRGQSTDVTYGNGSTSVDQSASGSIDLTLPGGKVHIQGSVDRFSVAHDPRPENQGQYFAANLQVDLRLSAEEKRAFTSGDRSAAMSRVNAVAQRLNLSGAALQSFQSAAITRIARSIVSQDATPGAARLGVQISLGVQAQWEMDTNEPYLTDALDADFGALQYVRVGVGNATSLEVGADIGVADFSIKASRTAMDYENVYTPTEDITYMQGLYFGNQAIYERRVGDYPEGRDTQFSERNGSGPRRSLSEWEQEWRSWEHAALRNASNDPTGKTAHQYLEEYREAGRITP